MRTFVEISCAALAANFRAIRSAVGERIEVLAVLKADAYGHGAVRVAQTLEAAGARWFAVTSIGEGVELRQNGVRGRILVLAEFPRNDWNRVAEFNLTLMIHSVEDLRELAAWARLRQYSPQFHLKLDSGMGRLGMEEGRIAEFAEALAASPHLRPEGVATHFAAAEDLAGGQTQAQLDRFTRAVERLAAAGIRPPLIHMANSAALAYLPSTWGAMVRPGLALYGYLMTPRGGGAAPAIQVQPALSWKAQILTVKDVPAGVARGYTAAYRTERPMRVGVIAAGYADGVDRRLSNGGVVLAAGARASIVGLVSMDVCLVDLSGAPGLRPGDYVTLIGTEGGETIDAHQIAGHCGTIPYEVLVRIGKRVTRVYR